MKTNAKDREVCCLGLPGNPVIIPDEAVLIQSPYQLKDQRVILTSIKDDSITVDTNPRPPDGGLIEVTEPGKKRNNRV